MTKACLSLLAGAYALHFTSFTAHSDLATAALFGTIAIFLLGGRTAMLWFACGLLLFAMQARRVIDDRLDARFEGDSLLTIVRVTDFPRQRNGTVAFAATGVADTRLPRKFRLTWFGADPAPRIGDVWQLEIRLWRPRGLSNPGVFDYETWLFRERVGATGYVVAGHRNRRLRSDAGGRVDAARKAFVERLETLSADDEAAAVIAAIAAGARHRISDAQWRRYARSGTSHLMAISGLHVGLAAAAAYWLMLVLGAVARLRGNNRSVALLASLLAAAAYAAITGLAVPARRATLMLLLLVVVLLRGREPAPFALLGASCMLVVVLDPLATLAAGFKLSFAAMLLLLWHAARRDVTGTCPIIVRAGRRCLQLASVQLFLLLGLLPLTVLIFGRIAIAAPVVNLVAVPLFSAVTVPLALSGLVLSPVAAPVGDAALEVAALSVQLIERLIGIALSLPHASAATATVTGVAWFFLVLVLAWVVLPPGWPGRHVAWLAAAAIAGFRVDGPPAGCVDARMLDVGQGQAIVLRTRAHVMLYDTAAAAPGRPSLAERVVLPYLRAQGVGRVDRLIVSHADADHAGGLADILAAVAVGDVLAGEPGEHPGVAARACRQGETWHWDGVEFRILHPPRRGSPPGNDASCVLAIDASGARLLLTGDISAAVERDLAALSAVDVDVIQVPHHGSDTSSSPGFVAAVSADLALVSAGYRNRWGLPRPDVVRRWRASGAELGVTAADGAIGVRLCGAPGAIDVVRSRERMRRLWHEP